VKNIVVYIILILGLTSLNSAAQKPSIGLLPTASVSFHPEAIIDTSITPDSLHRFVSPDPLSDTITGGTTKLKYSRDATPTFAGIRLGLYPLIFKKKNPIRFIIFFTALKF
jgi:hypothetical protein